MDIKKLDNPIVRGIFSGLILMSPLFTIFAGIPMIAPYFENRLKSFSILAIALIIVGFLVSPFVSIFYLFFIFVPFFVFLEISNQRSMSVSFPSTLLKTLLVFFALFTIIFSIVLYNLGGVEGVYNILEKTFSLIKSLNIETILTQSKLTKKEFMDIAITNSLASVFGFLFIFMFFNSLFISRFIPSYSYFFSKLNYGRYRLDDIFYILSILAIAVYVSLDYFNINNTNLLFMNMNIIGTAYVKIIFLIFAFYGLMVWYSVTSNFFKSPIWQRMFFIMTVVFVGYFIAIIGFIDMWFDIRKLMKRRRK